MGTHRSRQRKLSARPGLGKKPDDAPTPLDVAEALHIELERIDALASVVVERLQDLGRSRVVERRFARLVGILADACEKAHAAGSKAIERVTRAGRAAP
jgi:hypothetical protein